MVGCTETSGVGGRGQTVVGSSAKAMSRNLSALANRRHACEAGDSPTDEPGRKGVPVKGGAETEESTGGDPMTEIAADN